MNTKTRNKTIEPLKVYKTTNYDKFKFVESNRKVSLRHVKEIISEIQRINLTSENPIKVTRSHEIMEGQHTFRACKVKISCILHLYKNV